MVLESGTTQSSASFGLTAVAFNVAYGSLLCCYLEGMSRDSL
jgi:hypothetical protein